jgi:hypothetical protein
MKIDTFNNEEICELEVGCTILIQRPYEENPRTWKILAIRNDTVLISEGCNRRIYPLNQILHCKFFVIKTKSSWWNRFFTPFNSTYWRSIKTAPNSLNSILVSDGESVWIDQKIGKLGDNIQGEYYFNGHDNTEEVTLWMPIPLLSKNKLKLAKI